MTIAHCVNCEVPMTTSARVGLRGPDIAWMSHCKECAALVEDQMELISAQPGGVPIDIYRCRTCLTPRACRPRWRTRCMVCLDDRAVLPKNAAKVAAKVLDSRGLRSETGEILLQAREEDLPRSAWQLSAYDVIADRLASAARPGWTVLATDICGLPWDAVHLLNAAPLPLSHGTWGRHDGCGTVQNLAKSECVKCPPEEDSRTYRAKADRPHHLYLMRSRKILKFGHGNAARVREHIRGGAGPICGLTPPHAPGVP